MLRVSGKKTIPVNPRILIIKKWALGDILMATPILRQLKECYPDCYISWLADSRYADILEGNPYLDDVIHFESVTWRKYFRRGNIIPYLKMSFHIRRLLLAKNYDIVIALTPEKWWMLWFLAAPYRIGLFPDSKPNWMAAFYTDIITRPHINHLHSSQQYLMALQPLQIFCENERMSIGKTDDEDRFIQAFNAAYNNCDKRLIVITPISTEENRTLSGEMCAQLCRWLFDKYQARIVLSSTRDNEKRLNEIKSECGVESVIVACNTNMREFVALIRNADLVITCDSSPVHIAGALETPYVALFGPIPAIERIPYGGIGVTIDHPISDAPCRTTGCNGSNCRKCVKEIDLQQVKEKVDLVLKPKV